MGQIHDYRLCRVSTSEQDTALQLDALQTAHCERVYQEAGSESTQARPELARCLEATHSGDTLVVWRLDRLGRSLKDLVTLLNELNEAGVGFRSLTESIDTTSSSGKLVFHIFAALSEFERTLIQERTKAGLVAARARGHKGDGRANWTPTRFAKGRPC